VQSNGIALALHGEAQHGASQLIGLLLTDLTAVARRFFLATNRCLFSPGTKSACISRRILCRKFRGQLE